MQRLLAAHARTGPDNTPTFDGIDGVVYHFLFKHPGYVIIFVFAFGFVVGGLFVRSTGNVYLELLK